MIPKIYVSLIIEEQGITPTMLREFNRIGATKCWERGQHKDKTALVYPNNGCMFTSEPVTTYYAEKVAITFLKQLIVSSPELFESIDKNQLSPMLTIAAYVSDVFPSIYIESDDVRLIAKYNISVNIDCILTSEIAGT